MKILWAQTFSTRSLPGLKKIQTERTRRLAHLLSFCELVLLYSVYVAIVNNFARVEHSITVQWLKSKSRKDHFHRSSGNCELSDFCNEGWHAEGQETCDCLFVSFSLYLNRLVYRLIVSVKYGSARHEDWGIDNRADEVNYHLLAPSIFWHVCLFFMFVFLVCLLIEWMIDCKQHVCWQYLSTGDNNERWCESVFSRTCACLSWLFFSVHFGCFYFFFLLFFSCFFVCLLIDC